MIRNDQVSNQDYSLIKIATKKQTDVYGAIYNFSETSIGFQFLVLSSIFKRQEDEIINDITDSVFLQKLEGVDSGPDRGVDALIIDNEERVIHIFNFKYTEKDLDRVRDKQFPGSEVNDVLIFLKDLYEKKPESFSGNSANSRLEEKVKEIWKEQNEGTIYKFKVYFGANIFKGLTEEEDKRFTSGLESYRGDVEFDYILTADISDILTSRLEKIDCKFKALSNNFFDKVDGGNRALILEIQAIDLLRITTDCEELRDAIDFEYVNILESNIEENVFDDNVRVYLKQRSSINQNIKKTALDDAEKTNIFFYNNGITITCDDIDYQGSRNQTITLKNFQIVNGGQTIHALRNAFEDNQKNFDEITLLCKIYETAEKTFKSKIAEYTNSQNAVNNRDIRSIDLVQVKLEQEFKLLDFFYERKKNQHEREEKNKKIDAEKLGQSLLAFKLDMPAEAKNKKSIIFGEKYEEIFNDNLLVKDAVDIYNLYLEIEKRKIENKMESPFLMHATYYIMFFIKKFDGTIKSYDEALAIIKTIIRKEKSKLGENYTDAVLFKSNRPKEYLTSLGL
jgi:hypothetical protein